MGAKTRGILRGTAVVQPLAPPQLSIWYVYHYDHHDCYCDDDSDDNDADDYHDDYHDYYHYGYHDDHDHYHYDDVVDDGHYSYDHLFPLQCNHVKSYGLRKLCLFSGKCLALFSRMRHKEEQECPSVSLRGWHLFFRSWRYFRNSQPSHHHHHHHHHHHPPKCHPPRGNKAFI